MTKPKRRAKVWKGWALYNAQHDLIPFVFDTRREAHFARLDDDDVELFRVEIREVTKPRKRKAT